jgi:nitrous oxide reductase accessory protein NosL
MKHTVMLMIMILVMASAFAGAMDTAEGQKKCKICGMDRAVFARSRMLIVYADEARVGVCSLHCAVADQQHNRVTQVGSLMVADYFTKELIDAKKAIWVVGGKKKGVMTALAKWAFSREEGARMFMKGNGGIVKSFEQAMNIATMEVMDQAAEDRAAESELIRELQ